jgi:Holliday junction resolvasome RuvABC endonuclease subunit
MAHDPSLTAWGWVVINQFQKVVAYGAIKTEPSDKKLKLRKGDDRMRRISEINEQLKRAMTKHDVRYMLAELPHGSQSASAAVMVGVTSGIIQTISVWSGIAVEWYSEHEAKKSVCGN